MVRLFPAARRAIEADRAEPPVWEVDIAARRDLARKMAAADAKEEVAEVAGIDADGVPCRLYTPEDVREGLIVHLHGGGFVFNDVEVHDGACRRLANRSGLRVLSVEYRRPPEHRYPAAPDDVDTVIKWVRGDQLLSTLPTYVHGDSAGGNLALVAALRNPGNFRAMVLVYPFLDPSMSTRGSAMEDGWREESRWYWKQYAATVADLRNPDLGPYLAPDEALRNLPPTLMVSAEGDILTEENEDFALRLANLGVEVVAFRAVGQIHGFWRHGTTFPAAESVMAMTAAFLNQHSLSQHSSNARGRP